VTTENKPVQRINTIPIRNWGLAAHRTRPGGAVFRFRVAPISYKFSKELI